MATAYNDIPSQERLYGNMSCIAGSGGVVANTFVSVDGNTATTATSGHAFIATETAAEGAAVNVKFAGCALLLVNANSTNISGGSSKLMPTTAGYGIVAETDKDDYSCIAVGDSTTDADVIRVVLAHGTENI